VTAAPPAPAIRKVRRVMHTGIASVLTELLLAGVQPGDAPYAPL
jgi:hypothetical protein